MIWSYGFRLLAMACMATATVRQNREQYPKQDYRSLLFSIFIKLQKLVTPIAFLSKSEP